MAARSNRSRVPLEDFLVTLTGLVNKIETLTVTEPLDRRRAALLRRTHKEFRQQVSRLSSQLVGVRAQSLDLQEALPEHSSFSEVQDQVVTAEYTPVTDL